MFSMDRASQWDALLSDPDVPAILEAIYDAIDPTVTGKDYYPAPENVLKVNKPNNQKKSKRKKKNQKNSSR